MDKMLGHGFPWFVGIVEDISTDPEQLGRLKVRAFNYHTMDKNLLPTADLPWAYPLNCILSASLGGVGTAPLGVQIGSQVIGWFMDGKNGQIPIVFGTIAQNKNGINDLSPLTRGINTVVDDLIGPEPKSAYAAVYPHNKAITTTSGHIIEIDDTPGHERIRLRHRTGTYEEINETGRTVTKSVDDNYTILEKDDIVYIVGNTDIQILGDAKIQVGGNLDVSCDGNASINAKTITLAGGGPALARVGDSTICPAGPGVIVSGSEKVNSG